MVSKLFLFVLCFLVKLSAAYNILVIIPHVAKSHQLVYEPLLEKLISNGHKVTLITRFPFDLDSPNWRTVNVAKEHQHNTTELFTFDLLTGTKLDKYACAVVLSYAAEISCSEGLSHQNLHSFLKEDNKFDVVIIEMFNTNCFMGVAQKYKAPIIGTHSSPWMPWMYQWTGVPYNPGYLPNHFLGVNMPPGFLERLESTVMHLYTNIFFTISMAWRGDTLSQKYLGIDLYQDGDSMKKIDMFFIHNHFSLNLPMPLPPNVIEIGGIHLDSRPVKKLPQIIEKFIEDSHHGIIYISMGSTIRGDSFPEAKRQAFLKAFSKLPQRIIWKWEGKMQNKPDNVLTTPWAPQRDILCHPKVRVFISHSGLLGMIESIDCGKPILLLPQFGDQFTNAKALEKIGGGLSLNLNDLTEEILLVALKQLLSPQFAQNAQAISERFKDRPLSAMDTALYWIDYAVKHNGTQFLKTGAVDIPIYQYWLLDVIAVLVITLSLLVYVFYLLLKCIGNIFKRDSHKIKVT